MKTVITIAVTMAALFMGATAEAKWLLKGPQDEVESGGITFNLGREDEMTCEEEVEVLKVKVISLQCELEVLQCIQAGGSPETCHPTYACLQWDSNSGQQDPDRWDTQSTNGGDSPVDGGGIRNNGDVDIDVDTLERLESRTIATIVDAKDPKIINLGAVSDAICNAYSKALRKQIQTLQSQIDDLKTPDSDRWDTQSTDR